LDAIVKTIDHDILDEARTRSVPQQGEADGSRVASIARLKRHVSQGAIIITQEIECDGAGITSAHINRHIENIIVERTVSCSIRVAVLRGEPKNVRRSG